MRANVRFQKRSFFRYRNKVKEIAELALDQPMTGLEKAVWWTEYVIRHKGARHLRSPALNIPFYQYYLLDIIGFVVAALCLLCYTFYLAIKLAFRIFSCFIRLRKVKNE